MAKETKSKSRVNKKTQKEIKKNIKKLSFGGVFAIILCLVVGVVGGVFAERIITKDDCFVLNGNKTYTIKINEDFVYIEEGFKCISMGKDLSNEVKIETNMTKNEDGAYSIDTSVEGEYYIIYTINNKKFEDIKRVRTFKVGETNE